MIKLYWWNGGPRGGNFGDELSQLIVGHLSRQRVVWAPIHRADLVAIGSLLEPHFADVRPWKDYSGAVWGSGRMEEAGVIDLGKAHVAAVRGRLTRGAIAARVDTAIATADPALLVREFVPRRRNGATLGIVPHWSEHGHAFFQSSLCRRPGVRVIDPCQGLKAVLDELSGCEYLLSSSLHGLVVADALGIPNGWLRLGTGRESEDGYPSFKYQDYYSAFNDYHPESLCLRGDERFDEIVPRLRHAPTPEVDRLCAQLVRSFPFAPASASLTHEDVSSTATRCVVLVPTAAGVEGECRKGLQELEQRGYEVRTLYGVPTTDQARCRLATDALRDGFEALVWIDPDIGFDPAAVDRLRSHDRPFVCGVAPDRGGDGLTCTFAPGGQQVAFGTKGGLAEVAHAGLVFAYTRAEVYAAVRTGSRLPVCPRARGGLMVPYFLPMLVPDGDGACYLGGDEAFCERARRAGVPVLADTTIRLRRVGGPGGDSTHLGDVE